MSSQASTVTGLGLAALLCGAIIAPACDSGGNDARGGDSAGASSGGSSAGATSGGSSTGGASAGTTSGGSGGSGGASTQVVTACPGVLPPAALISDFAMAPAAGDKFEWGSAEQGTDDFWGGLFNYPDAVTTTVADGVLTAAGNVSEFAGFGLYVQNCADASSFDGVRFTISGNPPGGKLHFALQVNQNEWATGVKGSCLAPDAQKFVNCVHPSVEITVTDTPTVVEVKWSQLAGGKPTSAATTDASDVIGLQWILPWVDKMAPYDVSVVLDDVEFTGTGGGAGGAGGAGNQPGGGGAGGAP
jgi:hypothetical protein